MFRKLLACLALLTGLAAAGAPAQAELAGALASRIEASATLAKPASGIAAAVSGQPRTSRSSSAMADNPAPRVDCSPQRPGVRLGCDRARE